MSVLASPASGDDVYIRRVARPSPGPSRTVVLHPRCMQSIADRRSPPDPPTPVLMLPLGNSSAEAGQAPGATAKQGDAATLRAAPDAGAQASEGVAGAGGEEQPTRSDAPGGSDAPGSDAGAGEAGDDSALVGAWRSRARVCAPRGCGRVGRRLLEESALAAFPCRLTLASWRQAR